MNIDISFTVLLLIKVLWYQKSVIALEYNDKLSEESNNKHIYTNKWVVHVEDEPDVVRELVEKHNFIFHGQLGSLKHLYHIEHSQVSTRSRRSADGHDRLLGSHPKVLWIEQQKVKSRRKRDYIITDPLWPEQWYLQNKGRNVVLFN